MIVNSYSQSPRMPTGSDLANSLLTPDWLSRAQMTAQSSYGTWLRDPWLRASMIMRTLLTQLDSTLTAPALRVAAQTDPSRSGTSAARDSFSTTMLTKKQSIRWPSTLMAGTCSLHLTIQLSRYGTWDRVISSTLYMVMRAPPLQLISLHVETISALLASILW